MHSFVSEPKGYGSARGGITRRRLLGLCWLMVASVALVSLGCSRGASTLALDESGAQAAMKAFLDHWKSGGTEDNLATARPGLVVGDVDWQAGAKLVDYTIKDGGVSDGTNMHITVELKLESDGSSRTSDITYVVGTSPVETIFRK